MLHSLKNGRRLRKRRPPDWVCKSDLRRYSFNCAQAFWLIDQGKVVEPISERHNALMEQGVAFEDSIEASALPRQIPPGELPAVMADETIRLLLLRSPTFENNGLQIYGRPDAVDTANGAVYPVEIKRRPQISWFDAVELVRLQG